MRNKLGLVLSFLLLLLSSTSTPAEDRAFYLGGKGGFTVPKLTSRSSRDKELSKGYSSYLGQYWGFAGEYHFTNRFALRTLRRTDE